MSYLEKLLEGYFAGLATPASRDRGSLQRELTAAEDPIIRGNLLGELATVLALEVRKSSARMTEPP